MEINDKVIDYLEQHIPELADVATKQAYWQALASGSSVLIVENGKIIEIFPDGTKKTIKTIAPQIPMTKGQIFEIK